MTDFTIDVKLDLEKDARNYRSAFNKNTHSAKWKEQIASISTIDIEQLSGMEEKNAYPFLREYLENFWQEHKEKSQQKTREMKNTFDQKKIVYLKEWL